MGVGVTDFIKIDDVRKEIDAHYSRPSIDVDASLEVEHRSHSHRLVGVAFDSLCRYWLSNQAETVVDPDQSRRRQMYTGLGPKFGWSDELEEEFELAEQKREQFIETGMNADQAIEAALFFAGWKTNEEPSSIDLDSFSDDLVEEIQDLFHTFRGQDWTNSDTVFLGPNFGKRSYILEGEADFIVDDTLVDVKTTENPIFTKEYWRQLLAYYLLNDIHRVLCTEVGEAGGEYPGLSKVGVYFARHGELVTVDMESVIDDSAEFERFRAWFVDRAIEENHNKVKNYDDIRAVLTEPYDFEQQTTLFDY